MKIVADENIPFVDYYFASAGELVLKPGRAIQRQDVLDADILLVRSVTQVNKNLLHDTSVKLVASATTGSDHLDTDWLDQAGIQWAITKGCNATAVVDYVISVIAALQKQGDLPQKNVHAGVIGVGEIGSEVAKKLQSFNFEVILCDPFRHDIETVSLEKIQDLDFITLHTPLTRSGQFPTFHMIEKNFLQHQKADCVLLNAGRGSVINFQDLKAYGQHLKWCLDVWENEPNIDLEVLQKSLIATPHIAGYSVQSRYRSAEMLYQAVLKTKLIPDKKITPMPLPTHTFTSNNETDWRDVVLKIYDPRMTTQHTKSMLLENKASFDQLRKNFPERQELSGTCGKIPFP